jgi:hypothetical protein
MSSSIGSAADKSERRSRDYCCGTWGSRANWSGLNIAAMVVGFVVFWPIGLLILYWIIRGRSVKELPNSIREQCSRMGRSRHRNNSGSSDNVVFDEFQQTQYDRIREIKDEIKERSRRFTEFRANAKRRADEEEFNRFMDEAPVRNDG